MEINASEFKAKCLGILDDLPMMQEPVYIKKHGKVVAKLTYEKPTSHTRESIREKLRTSMSFSADYDPFEPIVPDSEIEVLKDSYLI